MIWAVYIAIGLAHLAGILMDSYVVQVASKVLLMPSLMLIWWRESAYPSRLKVRLMLALLFSWMGDLLLMQSSSFVFFGSGLAAFLIAHLFYMVVFRAETRDPSRFSLLLSRPYLSLPFLLYGIVLLILVFPGLGALAAPVVLYAVILLSMSVMALNRKGFVAENSWKLVFIGSVLFVLSDSMIAINKFRVPFELSRFLIMLTYIAAQGLIVYGVLRNVKLIESTTNPH